ncbi:hypothetical protein TYRP_000265 [Tyrophagus putrescentiae]|nr:hypothetical protein TYRP_000265 [Tyrophagus putrescentiae]
MDTCFDQLANKPTTALLASRRTSSQVDFAETSLPPWLIFEGKHATELVAKQPYQLTWVVHLLWIAVKDDLMRNGRRENGPKNGSIKGGELLQVQIDGQRPFGVGEDASFQFAQFAVQVYVH